MPSKSYIKDAMRIQAQKKFIEDYDNLLKVLDENPIAQRLIFKKRNGRLQSTEIAMARNSRKSSDLKLFQASYEQLDWIKAPNVNSNFEEVKKELLAKYEKEETDKLLNEIGAVRYLLENQGRGY